MLSLKQESISNIAALTAVSDTKTLAEKISKGLSAGLSVGEITEIFIQLCLYCGFPRGIRGVDIFMEVLAESDIDMKPDKTLKELLGTAKNLENKYEQGEKVQTAVTGFNAEQLRFGAMAFIPQIDVMLKEYIFNDVYQSDILSHTDREIVTVSALLAMNNIAPQIQFHINSLLHLGLSEKAVNELIDMIEDLVGTENGRLGRELLSKVLLERE